VRAVLDTNVFISALLSRSGTPARIVERWLAGEFELVVSESLLSELEKVLAYQRVRSRIGDAVARDLVAMLRRYAIVASEVDEPPVRSDDPKDDYLLALAAAASAALVSGDVDLLAIEGYPVYSPRAFLDLLERRAV
jgi:putative PIN family toxin of toxin-antitoxin system